MIGNPVAKLAVSLAGTPATLAALTNLVVSGSEYLVDGAA
jgi:hypothetical protein